MVTRSAGVEEFLEEVACAVGWPHFAVPARSGEERASSWPSSRKKKVRKASLHARHVELIPLESRLRTVQEAHEKAQRRHRELLPPCRELGRVLLEEHSRTDQDRREQSGSKTPKQHPRSRPRRPTGGEL